MPCTYSEHKLVTFEYWRPLPGGHGSVTCAWIRSMRCSITWRIAAPAQQGVDSPGGTDSRAWIGRLLTCAVLWSLAVAAQ